MQGEVKLSYSRSLPNDVRKLFFNSNLILPLILVVICVLTSFIEPKFLSIYNFQNLLRQIAVLAILAYGQTFVMLTRNFDLSVGSVVAISGVVCAILVKSFGLTIGIVGTLVLGAGIGSINGWIVASLGIPSLIATLGTLTIIRGLIFIITSGEPITGLPSSFRMISTMMIGPIPFPAVISVFCLIIGWFVLTKTVFGRQVYAVGGNEEAAYLCGIPIRWNKVLVFAISGLSGALGGILLATRVNSGQPTIGDGLELQVIAAVAIGAVSLAGGIGSVINVTFGVLLLGLLVNSMNLMGVSSYVQLVLTGLVLIVAVTLDRLRRARKG